MKSWSEEQLAETDGERVIADGVPADDSPVEQ